MTLIEVNGNFEDLRDVVEYICESARNYLRLDLINRCGHWVPELQDENMKKYKGAMIKELTRSFSWDPEDYYEEEKEVKND